MLATDNFPDNMKIVDIAPVVKRKGPLQKESYRDENVLSAILKIFEKIMQSKPPYLCGYRRKVLVHSLEKKSLIKTFDIIKHDLLIAKPHAYDFNNNLHKLCYSYLNNR